MIYEIECFIETIDSEGNFTIRGSEGFSLEKEDKTYNILWSRDKSNELVAFIQNELNLKLNLSKQQRMFQLLLNAKVNHQEIMMKVDCEKKSKKITSINKVILK